MSKSSILSNKKIILPGIAVLLALGASFAYFSDRVETRATVTTGENPLDITIDPGSGTEDDLSQKWADANAEALANYNPGDKVDLGFELKNTGSKAVDVRETFFITSSEALDQTSPEYRLFLDAIQDAAGAWEGSDVVAVEQIDTNTIKYSVAPYVLSSETEAIDNNPIEVSNQYKLVFDKDSENVFQGSTCTVELLIEAKQHTEDGPDGGWTTLETAEIEIGGQTVNAVPKQ